MGPADGAPRTGMRTSDYDFALPPERIAQAPVTPRDASRLMVVDRTSGGIAHHHFRDFPQFLRPGDVLALNTTRVFKARLLGHRDSGAPAEIFLLRPLEGDTWEAMVQPGGKLRPGRQVHIAPGFSVEVLDATERGTRVVKLLISEGTIRSMLEAHGHVPLPPYIARADGKADAERYQTVFARQEGSVAAPTAGLHFTPELLAAIEALGVARADLLLHVGAGTFKPVEVEDPADHVMHEEWFHVGATAAELLTATRRAGGRVCAVGTTALRTLETIWSPEGRYTQGEGETAIFIRPPHRPRAADLLVTNFHLPRSTLLMLVAATAGYELTMHAYDVAVREGYRFYSYGDAMLVL
jgi:S-adenosylmethionine:tRNA ribosyltransferase-isomerase